MDRTDFKFFTYKSPDNPALYICNENKQISCFNYKQIREIHLKVIGILKKENVTKTSCIGVIVERSIVLPPVITGILEYGCTFICLESNISERNYKLITDLGIKLLFYLKSSKLLFSCKNNTFALKQSCIVTQQNHCLEVWISNNDSELKLYPNICYIITTSGSTGEPKIVRVTHDSILSNLLHLGDIFQISSRDVIFLNTPITFDPFFIELFLALMNEASLLIVSPEIRLNEKLLLEVLFSTKYLDYEGITFLQIPPFLFFRWQTDDIKNLILSENSRLRILALGGERFCNLKLFRQIKDSKCRTKIYNLYGITEMSCWSSIYEVHLSDYELENGVPIGTPLKDTVFKIIDDNGEIIDNGEGELFLGSNKRLCYIDNEVLDTNKNLIYRATGDIVKIQQPNIYFVGRKNNIIKRFGHKISLSKLENIVFESLSLKSCCVWSKDHSKLVLFIIRDETKVENSLQKLKQTMKMCYPEGYPDAIISIDNLPMTKHGKLDINELLSNVNTTLLENSTHYNLILNLCNDFLNLPKQFEFENKTFSELGGTSIAAMQITKEFESVTQLTFPTEVLTILLDHRTPFVNCLTYFKNEGDTISFKRKIDGNVVSFKQSKYVRKNYTTGTPNELTILWSFDTGACIDGTPVISQLDKCDIVVIGSHSHKVFIINADTGQKLSEILLPDRVEGTVCITCCKQFAIVGCYDGYVYCIKISSAQIHWQYKTDSKVKCTPMICQNGTAVVVGSYDRKLHCIDVQNGFEKWTVDLSGSVTSAPYVKGTNIYVATIQGSCFCINEQNGEIIWRTNVINPVFGSPGCIENVIFWPDVKGTIHCFNCENGVKISDYKTNSLIYSSLKVDCSDVYVGCHDHFVYRFGYNNSSLNLLYKIKCNSLIFATPFIYALSKNQQKYIVVACVNGTISLYDSESSDGISSLQLPGELFSSPIVHNHKIYIGCRNNNLYCIDII